MRILRRRSNLEVSSKGFALFVAGLVVASFLGGAVRTLLSSERVHQRIVRELKSRFPKNQIDIGRIEVLLSRGFWPGLGLRVRDLVVGQDLCGKLSFVIRVPEAVLPISLASVRTGRVRLGQIDVPGGQVDLDFHACPKADAPDAPDLPSLRQTVQARGIRPPRLDWSDVADALEGVRVANFGVSFRRTPQWKLNVQTARVRFGRELTLQADLDVQRSLPFGTLSHAVSVNAVGSRGEIEWLVTSELKEGRLRWNGRWNLGENTAWAQAQLTQVPLKELALELHQVGALARELKFKSAWLTCAAKWAGPLGTPFKSPVELSGCRVEGGYGRAQLDRGAFFLDRQPPFAEPAEVRVQRAQLQGLAEAAGVKLLPAVLARPGVWSGSVFVTGAHDWTALGRLEELEVTFSSQSVRGKQLVSGVDVRVRREGERLTGTLDKIIMAEGAAEGRAEVRYDLDQRAGEFDVRFDSLSFSPAIQALLVGGRVTTLKVRGAGVFKSDQLAGWDGEARAAQVAGEGWRADDVAVRAAARGEAVHVESHATRVSVDPRWRYHAALGPAFPPGTEDFAWRDVVLRAEVRADGGRLSSLSAPAVTGRGEWRMKGDWRRDGEFFSTLTTSAARGPAYRLRGERGQLILTSE